MRTQRVVLDDIAQRLAIESTLAISFSASFSAITESRISLPDMSRKLF